MFDFAFLSQTSLRQAVTDAYRRDEIEAVQDMLQRAQMRTKNVKTPTNWRAAWLRRCVPTEIGRAHV